MRILVVDDNRAMRMLIMRAFRQSGFMNHEFIEAANGLEALDLVDGRSPELVLLDINMELNGLEVARHLQATHGEIPFGFITAEADPQVLERCREQGARFVLQKPFDAEQLQKALGGLLR